MTRRLGRPCASVLLLVLSAAAIHPGAAHAQTAPATTPAPAGAAQPTTATQPGTAQPAAAQQAAAAQSSAQPTGTALGETRRPINPDDPFIPVDDPMLTPVPQADKVLSEWRDAIRLVRNRNPDLARAYAQILVSQGRNRQTLARSLPQLTGQGAGNYHLITGFGPNFNSNSFAEMEIPNPRDNYTAEANLAVPLFNLQAWYDRGTSKRAVQQSQYQAEDVERLVIGGLAQSILGVVTSEQLGQVVRVNLARALSNLELTKRRAELGAANAVDVLRAEQEVATSRAQVIEADETLRRTRENLGLALGFPEPYGVPADINIDSLRDDAKNTCKVGSSIESRPDIKAAEVAHEVAKRNVKSATMSALPTLNFTSRFAYNSITGTMPTRDHTTWTIGGLINWNLYDGGARYGLRTANQGLLEIANQDLTDKRRDAEVEVSRSMRGVTVAQANLEVAIKSGEIAHENARLATSRFVNGTGSNFDMLQTQSAARQAALDVTLKEFELLRAQIVAFLALASCDI